MDLLLISITLTPSGMMSSRITTDGYHHWLQTKSYEGKKATGKETGAGSTIRRDGVCRPVGKPIF
jgi:hypothetical protein